MKERLKNFKKKTADVIKKSYEIPLWKWLLLCFFIAVVEVFILEMLGRRSLKSPVIFIMHNPLVFLYNILIVLFSLSISLLFKRRGFAMGLIFLLWMGVGVINFVLLGYRITPFSAIDFLMFTDVLSMFNIYFNLLQRILIVVGIIVFIVVIVFAFLKIPKLKGHVNYVQSVIVVLTLFIMTYTMTYLALETSLISDKFTNLGTAYKSYGFVYCFSNSVIDQGITKPEDYTEAAITVLANNSLKAADNISSENDPTKKFNAEQPDVIIIQLESFIDIGRVDGVNTDIESIPNFKHYEEVYPSGFLTVPAIGAGTANTEFEVLTGMKSKVFGAGEYPYKTILTTQPCESLAQIFRNNGYGTHAIHNNKAKFYSRDETYANMGFETFTSLEYILHYNKTKTGWAKDDCLPDEIIKCLDYDAENNKPGFVFTVSVQGHGRYPQKSLKCEEHVKVTLDNEDPELTNQFGYFVNQCYEMDEMIANLKAKLDERGKRYVLVLYGDHIPSLTFEDDQFSVGEQTQTEYVIISNYVLDLEDRDIYSYELSDYLIRAIGYTPGIMQDIHYTYFDNGGDNTIYDKNLLLAQYDMLYGNQYLYKYIEPYERVDMRLGLYDITLSEVNYVESNGGLIVKGENFTVFSKIIWNDERMETTYVDENTIILIPDEVSKPPEPGDTFAVAQIDKNKHELSRTNEIIYGD